jgi:hypothetical protein
MKRTRAPLTSLLLMLVGTLAFPRLTFACSCTPASVQDTFKHSVAVFIGNAQNVTWLEERGNQGDPRIVVTLEVVKSWKSPKDKPVVLHTVYNQASCDGYWFEEGKTYLVYAFQQDDGTLGASLCSRTTAADAGEAKEDVAVLEMLGARSAEETP